MLAIGVEAKVLEVVLPTKMFYAGDIMEREFRRWL